MDFLHICAEMGRWGLRLFMLFVIFLYGCYAWESHCLNPMGCIDPVEVKQDIEDECQIHNLDMEPAVRGPYCKQQADKWSNHK